MKRFIDWFNLGLPHEWDPIMGAVVAHFFIVSIHLRIPLKSAACSE
jgi:hypothetical protein